MNLILYRQPAGLRGGRIEMGSGGGFTLIELLIAIAIVAILAKFAVPSLSGLVANQRAKSVASELFATLTFARSAAITGNSSVTVSPKLNLWQNGWQVVDSANAVLDDRSSVSGVTITGTATSVRYRASGRIDAGAAPSFSITATVAGGSNVYQCLSIDLTGRPYTKAAASC